MTEKTISKHLKGLEDKMWLTRKRRYNNSYRYDLDRLARRVAWLAGDQTAMARDKFHPEQQAPSPPPPMVEQPDVEDERPRLAPSLEDIKKFMEDGE